MGCLASQLSGTFTSGCFAGAFEDGAAVDAAAALVAARYIGANLMRGVGAPRKVRSIVCDSR